MRKKIVFRDQAKADIRAISQVDAMKIFHAIDRLATLNEGDVRKLVGVKPDEWRLRVGDHRVRFCEEEDSLVVRSVKHRSRAYR